MLRGVEFNPELLAEKLSNSNFYLLYPGPDSIDCEGLPLSEQDSIIVLDGTWSEAGKILYRNPILKTLKKVSFKRNLKSEYKIRKQPKEKYLSTIESVGHLLKLNAATSSMHKDADLMVKYDRLFSVFAAMVDKQLAYWPE
jgi:DTW domain-containing protein YfiP